MCGFQDALSNIMPVDWLDPYGYTPFAKDAEMSVDITIVETDDGIRATSVKNPPKSGSNRLMNALKQVLGVDFEICGPQNGLQRSADLGKRESQNFEKDLENSEKSDKMESFKPEGFGNRDRNPGSSGSPAPSRHGATEDEDEEKAPRK